MVLSLATTPVLYPYGGGTLYYWDVPYLWSTQRLKSVLGQFLLKPRPQALSLRMVTIVTMVTV